MPDSGAPITIINISRKIFFKIRKHCFLCVHQWVQFLSAIELYNKYIFSRTLMTELPTLDKMRVWLGLFIHKNVHLMMSAQET